MHAVINSNYMNKAMKNAVKAKLKQAFANAMKCEDDLSKAAYAARKLDESIQESFAAFGLKKTYYHLQSMIDEEEAAHPLATEFPQEETDEVISKIATEALRQEQQLN